MTLWKETEYSKLIRIGVFQNSKSKKTFKLILELWRESRKNSGPQFKASFIAVLKMLTAKILLC